MARHPVGDAPDRQGADLCAQRAGLRAVFDAPLDAEPLLRAVRHGRRRRRLAGRPLLGGIARPPARRGRLPARDGPLHREVAGAAGHVVPPTGAKGLNLAVSDVCYLASALADAVQGRSTGGLEDYSDRALARVWKAVRFSWWLTMLMHHFPGSGEFDRRIQEAELDYLASSESAQRSFAENYTGLPLLPRRGRGTDIRPPPP